MNFDNNFYTTTELGQLIGLNIENITGDTNLGSPTSNNHEDNSSEMPGHNISPIVVAEEEPDLGVVNLEPEMYNPFCLENTENNTNTSNENIDHGNLQSARKRIHKPRKSNWKVNANKRLRMEGKQYSGIEAKTQTIDGNVKTTTSTVIRKAREMGPSCSSKVCEKVKNRYCSHFTDGNRDTIFQAFWKNMDWNQKHVYVTSLVDKGNTKQVRGGANSRRTNSYQYYLKLGDLKKQVCREMFLSTLGLRERQLYIWMNSPTDQHFRNVSGMQDDYNSKKNNIEKMLNISTFLDSLPKLPSHYCRKNTTKLYLEPIFTTKKQLYDVYKENCIEKCVESMSQCTFDNVFRSKNISLFRPKKDECDLCCSYKLGQVEESVYKAHIENKNIARNSKSHNKKEAIAGRCHVVAMDLQAVKLSPILKASSLYYKSKLIVHNFTVYDLSTHQAKIFWWNECEGQLCASTFTTCLLDFLSRFDDGKPIIIYSDGCTNQNRNAVMANGLQRLATNKQIDIYQNCMEKGHTQMEVDNVHSCIECAIKNVNIYHPEHFHNKCLQARKDPFCFESVYLEHTFFNNFDESKAYGEIRPGQIVGDPKVVNIRCLKYLTNGTIEYKLKYSDEWSKMPRNPKPVLQSLKKLYQSRLTVTKKKWKDLQALKPVIPVEYHAFYDNLPYDGQM